MGEREDDEMARWVPRFSYAAFARLRVAAPAHEPGG